MNITPQTTDALMASNRTGYTELVTPQGLGPESGRTVRICKPLTTGQISQYGGAAQSEVRSIGTMANLIADFALREAIQRIKADGLFRHGTKKICNELQGIVKSWKTDMRHLMGDRYEPMEDAVYDRQSELNGEFEMLRLQAKAYFLKNGNKHAETCAWVEMTQQMFVLSHMVIKNIVKAWYAKVGIDFSDVYRHMDLLLSCSRQWQKVCRVLYTYEQQNALVNHDTNFINAMKIYFLHVCSIEGMEKHFKTSIEEHPDVFSDEERRALLHDIAEAQAGQAARKKAEQEANNAYWARTRKTAKPRGSDVTAEDLQQLKKHFNQ